MRAMTDFDLTPVSTEAPSEPMLKEDATALKEAIEVALD